MVVLSVPQKFSNNSKTCLTTITSSAADTIRCCLSCCSSATRQCAHWNKFIFSFNYYSLQSLAILLRFLLSSTTTISMPSSSSPIISTTWSRRRRHNNRLSLFLLLFVAYNHFFCCPATTRILLVQGQTTVDVFNVNPPICYDSAETIGAQFHNDEEQQQHEEHTIRTFKTTTSKLCCKNLAKTSKVKPKK